MTEHTHSRRIVNVSMCLLLCIVSASPEKNKWPCNEARCEMTHPLFPILEVRPIGRESLSKQNLLCF